MSGSRVVECLEKVAELRGHPESITVDNGTEFCSKALDGWAYRKGVKLEFIRPGRPVENGFIESFNGRLRNECLTPICSGRLRMLVKKWKLGGWTTTSADRRASVMNCLTRGVMPLIDMYVVDEYSQDW